MSSSTVRQAILTFIGAQVPSESVIDLSAQFDVIDDLLTANSVTPGSPWLGVQFVGSEEIPVDVRGNNNQGKYREIGVIFLHVVDQTSLTAYQSILPRAEVLRNAFRGQEIASNILIEAVSPVNFGGGVTLSFTGGYTAGIIQIDYKYQFDL